MAVIVYLLWRVVILIGFFALLAASCLLLVLNLWLGFALDVALLAASGLYCFSVLNAARSRRRRFLLFWLNVAHYYGWGYGIATLSDLLDADWLEKRVHGRRSSLLVTGAILLVPLLYLFAWAFHSPSLLAVISIVSLMSLFLAPTLIDMLTLAILRRELELLRRSQELGFDIETGGELGKRPV